MEENGSAGLIPESGAIFMANIETKKECFKRKVFALPSFYSNFVKQVKAGMLLFLFEFEKRELFGVYQASTDGEMNILPQGSNSLLNQFPAQVCFDPIWFCDPLPEQEFHDVIRDNYFSNRKFNFGLSEDQVYCLLHLFSSRKQKNKLLPKLVREVGVPVHDLRHKLNKRLGSGNLEGRNASPDPLIMHEGYSAHQSKEMDYGIHFPVEVAGREDHSTALEQGFLHDHISGSASKKQRTENGDRLFTNLKDHGSHNHDFSGQDCQSEYPENTLDRIRQATDYNQFLGNEKVENEDKNSTLAFDEYPGGPFKVRRAANDMYAFCDRVEAASRVNGYLLPISSHLHGQTVTNAATRLAVDNDKNLMNIGLKDNYKLHDCFEDAVSRANDGDHLNKFRHWLDNTKQSTNHMDQNIIPITGPEFSGDSPNVFGRRTGDRISFERGRIDMKYDLGNSQGGGYFPKKYGDNFVGGRVLPDDGLYPTRDRIVNASHSGDDRLYPTRDRIVNANHSGEPTGLTTFYRDSIPYSSRRSIYDGQISKDYPVEDKLATNSFLSSVTSLGYGASPWSRQDPFSYSEGPFPERQPPNFSEAEHLGTTYLNCHESTVTRALPYDTGLNFSRPGCSPSFGADCCSALSHDIPPYHDSREHKLSDNRPLSYFPDEKLPTKFPNIASEIKDIVLLQPPKVNYAMCYSSNMLLTTDLPGKQEIRTSMPANSKNLLFSKSPSANRSLPESLLCRDEGRIPSQFYDSDRKLCFSFDDGYPSLSQGICERTNNQFVGQSGNEDWSIADLSPAQKESTNSDFECCKRTQIGHGNDHVEHPEGVSCGSKNNRRSVFARIASGPKVSPREKFNADQTRNTDASVDEVMDMLRQGQSLQVKQERCGKSARNHDEDIPRVKKHSTLVKPVDQDHPKNSSAKLKDDEFPVVEEDPDGPLRETRLVHFKRRSKAKDVDENTTIKASVQTVMNSSAGEFTRDDKPCRRRKLIRPAFGEKKSANEGMEGSHSLHGSIQGLGNDNTQDCKA